MSSYLQHKTQYAYIHPSCNNKSWYMSCGISRFYRSTISRLKFGHGQYPAHLARMKIIESSSCACGWENADLNHIFFGCQNHSNNINKFMQRLILEKVALPTNIVTLLATDNREVHNILIETLQRMKIII